MTKGSFRGVGELIANTEKDTNSSPQEIDLKVSMSMENQKGRENTFGSTDKCIKGVGSMVSETEQEHGEESTMTAM